VLEKMQFIHSVIDAVASNPGRSCEAVGRG
jgi:hypothetical protein